MPLGARSTLTMHSLVSVVIPCHNSASFLRQTVHSVFAQTYAPIQLIFVDDGSTDGTPDLIARLAADADAHGLTVECHRGPNRGASAARDTGMVLARGEFIQFLDADDLLRPTALAARVAVLTQTGANVAYSDWQRWREDPQGRFLAAGTVARTLEDVHQDTQIATFTSFWAPPAALLYRRDMVNRIGRWHPGLPVIQDARFLQDAAFHGARFVRVPEVLADYREHRSGSLSTANSAAFNRDVLENAIEIEQRWRGSSNPEGALTDEQRAALLLAYRHCAENLFRGDERLFQRACVRLEALGAVDDPLVRLWHRCERQGYRSVRMARAPMMVVEVTRTRAKRALRQCADAILARGKPVEMLP